MHERRHQPGAGAAEGVAQGDGAARGVDRARVGAGLGQPGHDTDANASLTSNAPMSARPRPGPLEHPGRRRDRSGQHRHRVDPGRGDGVHAGRAGASPRRARLLAGRDEQRGGAVGDLRGVAGRDHAVLPEGGRSPASFSSVVPRRMPSSARRRPPTGDQLGRRSGPVGGRGRPRVRLRRANSSSSVRDSPQRSAIISAPTPCGKPVVVAGASSAARTAGRAPG